MSNTIKLAFLGACALAASSTAAFAGSELARGLTTGLSIGMPLPEGVYDISIGSYGGWDPKTSSVGLSEAYAVPVWLVWWTPWKIAGGRIVLDATVPTGDLWNTGNASHALSATVATQDGIGIDSWLNTLVEAGIGWNLGGGWGVSIHAGAWLPSTQTIPLLLGRNYTAFQGAAAVSYVANGWNLSATGIYGSGGGEQSVVLPVFGALTAQQAEWVNLDLTATKHFGKFEVGAVGYGSWDLTNSGTVTCYLAGGTLASAHPCKQSQFAVGGLVGYNFGAFLVQAKLTRDVAETNYRGEETRGNVTFVTRLWNPETIPPLK
jgi:hypothetical protein